MNIYRQYQKSLTKEEQTALSFCSKLADDMKIKIYLVGGIVRDIILNRKFNDIDILVEDDAVVFGKILQKKYPQNIKIIAENDKFKTLKLQFSVNKKTFEADMASTRSEVYEYPSALPILAEIGVPLKKDILRRDFTVNALAMSLNCNDFCRIYDETEFGLDDLEQGLIRVLHPDSFNDDPSRIVRGLKYRAKLNFSLEEDTEFLQKACLESDRYTNDCQERIKKEINETLNLSTPYCYDKFISEKIYRLIIGNVSTKNIPGGNLVSKIISSYSDKIEKNNIWLIFLCVIFCFAPIELVKENIEKLALKKDEKNIINDFFKITEDINTLKEAETDYDVYSFFNGLSKEAVIAMLILSKDADITDKIILYLNKLCNEKLSVTGEDIKKFGIENGVIYKEILEETLKEKINKKLNSKEERHFFEQLCKLVKNDIAGNKE